MLTHRQKAMLEFIRSYQAERNGISPSNEEMREALNLTSKSQAHRVIDELVVSGHLRRLPRKARAIEIVTPEAWYWDGRWLVPQSVWRRMKENEKADNDRLWLG